MPHAGEDHDSAKQVVDAGKYVDIQEWRSEWLRVRVDQDEGWVRRSGIAVIWNMVVFTGIAVGSVGSVSSVFGRFGILP